MFDDMKVDEIPEDLEKAFLNNLKNIMFNKIISWIKLYHG